MIEIEVNIDIVKAGLTRLARLGEDMSPLTRDLAEVLKGGVDRAFADEEDPATGEKWRPLSPATLARRAKAGHTGAILQVSGQLAASIQTEHGPHFAAVGTNKVYAGTHQRGAKKGSFGQAKRGTRGAGRRNARNYTARGGATVGGWLSGRARGGSMPLPWGDIPARPFLGIGKPEEAEIEESVRRAVRSALEGA
ncbi:phage virion morphogenesis (putative tail completion) protein [Humidesulfovibrio mexicanus]|uniref:Phage virion morphogenesis (Putative tail completion) protein n=1 Tax=Humidesulfovibrio mexicanus TaxID=147047 RepID=A0A239AKF7_9BACT|nr:phage virion morphogenesis protein [Humidesulfovibrio mexicanus]SNR95403.1 phage virion morphogenesis (putative tail completion) protein [Humidesulfovibrio mexicanus]